MASSLKKWQVRYLRINKIPIFEREGWLCQPSLSKIGILFSCKSLICLAILKIFSCVELGGRSGVPGVAGSVLLEGREPLAVLEVEGWAFLEGREPLAVLLAVNLVVLQGARSLGVLPEEMKVFLEDFLVFLNSGKFFVESEKTFLEFGSA